jgi:hypothetical protein
MSPQIARFIRARIFPICNCVLNLLVSYPQNVQQIGKFAFGTPRCRLLSLVFAHNLKWNVYLACRSFGSRFEAHS